MEKNLSDRRNAGSVGAPKGPGSRSAKQGEVMLGAEAVVASLEAEGVDVVFGYPGGQAIRIYDALYDSERITHILSRHEQGAVHMADGYARATGRVGVVLVTSGPGAANTVTGIATAYMDSVPLVIITGQVPRAVIGTDSFQESDIFGITMPVVKHSFLLQSVSDLTRVFREAFHIAVTGRPGPVLIDVPSDIARETVVFDYPDGVNITSYKPTYRGNAKQIRSACKLIGQARRPVILAGGGVVSSGATPELIRLAELMRIPVVMTLMGKGGFPSSHPLNLGAVGMHGARYANHALTQSDLIIAAGARFSDRVTGDVADFAPNAKIIHIDIDPAEIGKILHADVPIVGDLPGVLRGIAEHLEKEGARRRRVARRDRAASRSFSLLSSRCGRPSGRDRPREGHGGPLGVSRSRAIDRDHRGGPASDVGEPVHRPRTAAHVLVERRLGDDGVRVSRRHRRRRRRAWCAWRAMARSR